MKIYTKKLGKHWTLCDKHGLCVHADGNPAYYPELFNDRPVNYPVYNIREDFKIDGEDENNAGESASVMDSDEMASGVVDCLGIIVIFLSFAVSLYMFMKDVRLEDLFVK